MTDTPTQRSDEWEKFIFKDVAKFLNGRAYKADEFKEAGTPIIRIQNLTGEGNAVYSDLELPESKYVESGDLIYAWSATFGPYIWKGAKSIYHYHIWKVVPDTRIIEKLFFYYHLLHVSDTLKDSGNGTLFVHITKELMESFEIRLPPLPEQKAISAVLSSLDDKIDLLHRQNKTLEAMAASLFRQWFVEEAKENWEEHDISQLVDIQNGYAFSSKDFKETGQHGVLKIRNIAGDVINITNTDFIDNAMAEKTPERFRVNSGDILIGMTGAEIGKLGIVPRTEKSLWLNQRVGLLKERIKGGRFLAYLHLKSEFGQDFIESSATGSAQPNISGTGIESCSFPKLDEVIIRDYAAQIVPFYEKLIFNLGQIQTLEKLRDTLLPKLMSGEVRVEV